MERWGVFSVIDHRDPIRLAAEVLLYDKLAVPTPADKEGEPDWQRWQHKKWDPEGLEKVLALLRPHNLVRETKWDAERQAEWASLLAEARADIAKVNAEMANLANHPDIKGDNLAALRTMEQKLPYMITRDSMIEHLRGQQHFHGGAVEFYAAYQSVAEFTGRHPNAWPPLRTGPRNANGVAASESDHR